MEGSTVWWVACSLLVSLLFFRANAALRRFWEGTSLLHQMRGEWFDAVSCCISFSRSAAVSGKMQEVTAFRHTLVRLMSLCHGSAMEEIKSVGEGDEIETIDVAGLDFETLKLLTVNKDEFAFNRVEMILHLMQTLITHAHEEGVMKIAPPILSRVYQTLSRGFVNLLNAKKIKDTLFPFPLAQLISAMLVAQIILTPALITVIFKNKVFAFVYTFLPVFGAHCINMIAQQLENPFGDDANDLPLDHFQSEMNKCLLMLLQPSVDHVPGISEDCETDFNALINISAAVRISFCANSKESRTDLDIINGATGRDTTMSGNKSARVGRQSVRSLVKTRESEGSPLYLSGAFSNAGTLSPKHSPRPDRSPRVATPSILQDTAEFSANPRNRSVTMCTNSSVDCVVILEDSEFRDEAVPTMSHLPSDKNGAKDFGVVGRLSSMSSGVPGMLRRDLSSTYLSSGQDPVLAGKLEQLHVSVQEWCRMMEDQLSALNQNTHIIDALTHAILDKSLTHPAHGGAGLRTVRPLALDQDKGIPRHSVSSSSVRTQTSAASKGSSPRQS